MEKYYAKVLTEYSSKKVDKTFTYIIKDELIDKVKIGSHVKVDFNNKIINGIVIDITNVYEDNYKLKEIVDVDNDSFSLNKNILDLCKYVSDITLSPLISCIQTALPPSFKIKDNDVNYDKYEYIVTLNKNDCNLKGIRQKEVVNYLTKNKYMYKKDIPLSTFNSLYEKGIINVTKKEKYRLENNNEVIKESILNEEQQYARDYIINSKKDTILLQGVTSSGKTEVYISLCKYYLENNKSVLILMPEISLTEAIVNRFYNVFSSKVIIFHSALSKGERHDQYKRILNEENYIVIGTRSSIFMPINNLGIIIIDEAHSDTYKQDRSPRYDAISCASFRIKNEKAKLLLSSATPLLEQKARAQKQVYDYVEIKKRYNNIKMPKINIIDMKKEVKNNNIYFSEYLKERVKYELDNNKQVIIFINRRGYSSIVSCIMCGYTYKCKHCDITLTYHKSTSSLRCHYCGYTTLKSDKCPNCSDEALNMIGLGTEKVAEMLEKEFGRKVLRMDQDTTSTKNSHKKILDSFAARKYDILVGTQMISKGLDFDNVRLVCIINADTLLNLPDFRANEKALSMLMQVSGRAGRREEGEVIIQTYNPDNEVLKFTKNHDYNNFYKYEMNIRNMLKYPPFYYLVSIKIISNDYDTSLSSSLKIGKYLKDNLSNDTIILGPTTHNIFKLNNKYRFVIVIKYKYDNNLYKILKDIDNEYLYNNKVSVEIDFDPRCI